VLPEKYAQNETGSSMSKIPEFPFAIPILLISIVSAIVFHRIKFGKLK
jgi:predicted secreted protein with PEFG-CTERM motif